MGVAGTAPAAALGLHHARDLQRTPSGIQRRSTPKTDFSYLESLRGTGVVKSALANLHPKAVGQQTAKQCRSQVPLCADCVEKVGL